MNLAAQSPVPRTVWRWLPIAAAAAIAAAITVVSVTGGLAGLVAAAAAAVVVLAWLWWAWPAVGAVCTSTVACAAAAFAVAWWITPPWLPGGMDWMVLAACCSLALAVLFAVLLLPARRGSRTVTALWAHALLAATPLITLPSPAPLLAAVMVLLACWIGWRAGAGRLPRVVLSVWAAKRRARAGKDTDPADRAPSGWPPLPNRWTLLRGRQVGRGKRGTPVEDLLMGPFGAACLATAGDSAAVPEAAHAAARAARAVSWALAVPDRDVHPIVLCPAADAPRTVWIPGRSRTEVTVMPAGRIRRLASTIPARPAGRGRRAAARAMRRADRLAAMMKTLPYVADRLLTVSGTANRRATGKG